MAFDDTFKLVDAAFDFSETTNVYPNANQNGFHTSSNNIALGRTGLPKGAQFAVILDNPAGDGSAAGLNCHLQLTLDNGSAWRTIATVEFGDPGDAFQGIRVVDIAQDFDAQEYADANIDIRMQVEPAGSNASNNITADKLAAFITQGESQKFGRKKTADTLFV